MGAAGVLDDGAVYVRGNRIEAVASAGDAPPAGFDDVLRIRTGDTIYPGLIELHNHLSYNVLPLWDVPQRFSNHEQWKRHPEYRTKVTKPAQVLGQTEGVAEALVRYVECRALIGGVTASQGVTLYGAGKVRSYYRGLVRNVEQPLTPGLPAAATRIADPAPGKAAEYLANLQQKTCLLQHLAEGVDDRAQSFFHRLREDNGDWALTDAFCGIHSTALDDNDFRILAEHGGSVVWSPLSNYLLYGKTTDVAAVHREGITIGLGCDWGPSGSKNLLGELKVALLASRDQGDVFTPEELVQMVTINPARIVRWEHDLGSIEAGKLADLVVVNGMDGDPYQHLVEARETSVTLVVVDGVPRIGQPHLMEPFGHGSEELDIGRSKRVLALEQEDAHPLVAGLGLNEALDRLRDAMARLPELAADIDAGTGLASGSAAGGAGGPAYRIAFDFEEEDAAIEQELGLGAASYADYVEEPMELVGLTVADDPGFLEAIVAARNVPEHVKKDLPPLFGVELDLLPAHADFLRDPPAPVSTRLRETTRDLATFLRTSGELGVGELRCIIDQARLVLQENYVHLPLKRSMYAVDPVQQLRLLRHRLDDLGDDELPPEIELHREIAEVFHSLRDLHTSYRLPIPFRGKVAWLPYIIEEAWERGERLFLVTKVVGDAGPETFVPGVLVTHWNGTPIARAVALHADRQPGGNPAARAARGVDALTIRPLVRGMPPDEEWVVLRYLDEDGEPHEYRQRWLLFEPGRGPHDIDPERLTLPSFGLGLDAHGDDVQQAKKQLFAGVLAEREAAAAEDVAAAPIEVPGDIPTHLPTIFRARKVETESGTFGYVRIFTFGAADATVLIDELSRLLSLLPREGLILDIRANPGGLIAGAEGLLQLLTPKTIEPQRAQFINSPLNLRICRANDPSPAVENLDLGAWVPSMTQAARTGATYSLGYPISAPEAVNRVGQRYDGPVVLVVDALCYSAADMFAAGFQDHGIGKIIGIASSTGAGGANVWSHQVLRILAEADEEAGARYRPLPHGSDLRVAIRRTVRVGPNAGDIVEDIGVVPDAIHRMTRRDVLDGNLDLVDAAAAILAEERPHAMDVDVAPDGDGRPSRLTVRTSHVTRLDVVADGRPLRSLDIHDGETHVDIGGLTEDWESAPRRVELFAYENDELVIRRRYPDAPQA